ncbi:MAG: protoporphyrinogen oxidase [Gemmatimonadetes bacterium]|nr:protoporphyrinogen oxidase [Gemmatimonadota bacterium]
MTVGIVGAGITGLSLAYYLRARGVPHICCEASAEPGGVIRTRELDGHVLELGPQRLRRSAAVAALVDALGLRPEVIEGTGELPLYVYFGGRLREVPFTIATFLRTDLLTWRGKLRLLAEPLVKRSSTSAESVADFFIRRFGREAYENFLGPLFGGIYGSDPRAMHARYALARLLALEAHSGSLLLSALRMASRGGFSAALSFRRGMQVLPRALYEANRENIHLETTVRSVRARHGGYVLATAAGEIEVERLVITTRADQAADLLREVAPEAATRLARLHYNPLAVVHLHSPARRPGLGYQIRADEDCRTLGVTWNAGIFAERAGVHTSFLGGWKHPDIVNGPEARIGEIARAEFETMMGEPARVIQVHRWTHAIPAHDQSWTALDGLELPARIHLATNYTSGVGVNARIDEANALAGRLADAA